MPAWVKVTLIAIAIGFAILVIGIVFAARWLKQRAGSLQREGTAVAAEARKFGEGKDAEACIAESLRRLDNLGGGFEAEVKARVFLRGCLDAATVTRDACSGVPRRDEFMKAVRWALDECARRGKPNDQRCGRILGELQERCER